jgi:hypothetical protein
VQPPPDPRTTVQSKEWVCMLMYLCA